MRPQKFSGVTVRPRSETRAVSITRRRQDPRPGTGLQGRSLGLNGASLQPVSCRLRRASIQRRRVAPAIRAYRTKSSFGASASRCPRGRLASKPATSKVGGGRMTERHTKMALITGVLGQDGTYLAELLTAKGYQVIGTSHRGERKVKLSGAAHEIDVLRLDLADGEA